jgi:protein O-mannosyl-transferase
LPKNIRYNELSMPDASENRIESVFTLSHSWRVALLVFVSLLAYANSLLNSFTMDDNLYVLTNPMVTHFSWPAIFQVTSYNNVFRPLTFASFALNWALGANHPFGYHLLNLLLHVAVVVLLYLVLQKLLIAYPEGALVSFVAALLFAVHPIHTEAVDSIAARSELLAVVFLLLAWLFHLDDWPVLSLISFLLALLAKESAVAFVPLVLVGDYVQGKLKSLYRYVLVLAVAIAYMGALWKIQGGKFGEKAVTFLDNPLAHLPASLRILNALRISWKYLALHLFPRVLSCDYSYNAILLYSKWRYGLLAAAATAFVLVLWLWALWTNRKPWVLAGAIYLAAFAVTANLLMPTGTIMAERLAYLPSAGFCLLLALICFQVAKRKANASWLLLGIVLIAFSARTVVRNRDWRDNFTLFSSAVKAVPRSAKAHSNLGLMYYLSGQLDDADRELQIALRIYPDFGDALVDAGLVASQRGNDQKARVLLEKALALTTKENPNYEFIAVNLAAVLMKLGQNDPALDLLNQEIAKAPTYSRAWSNRAVIRYQFGQFEQARADAQQALALDPSNVQARNLLSALNNFLPARATP